MTTNAPLLDAPCKRRRAERVELQAGGARWAIRPVGDEDNARGHCVDRWPARRRTAGKRQDWRRQERRGAARRASTALVEIGRGAWRDPPPGYKIHLRHPRHRRDVGDFEAFCHCSSDNAGFVRASGRYGFTIERLHRYAVMARAADQHGRYGKALSRQCEHQQPGNKGAERSIHSVILARYRGH